MFRPNALLVLFLGATAALPAALPAQLDDAMWFASRQGRKLTKISASGEVLASADLTSNGMDLSRVARMPDGRLWVINFITTKMTITDRNGANPVNIDTSAIDPTRGATDIVFDRTGVAWVTFNAVGLVARFAVNGQLLNTIAVSAFPLGITCDNQGGIWVGHRNNAPSTITRIDPVTFVATSYPIPGGARTMGGNILADSPGLTGNSKIWTCGDGGNDVVTFDITGAHLATYPVGALTTAGISGITLDGAGNVWVVHFRTATNRGDVYRLDRNTGAILHTIMDSPEPVGLTTDSFGRAWYLNRISFSGPTESEARRADLAAAGTFEVAAPIGIGAYQTADANGFHRAAVILPLGDADGDGVVNLIEVQQGSSPYDAQSTPGNTLLTTGPTRIGQTASIDLRGTAGPAVLGFATGNPVSLNVPGIAGQLRLDPAFILGFTLALAAPTSVPIAIPNDPTLVGFVLRMQALKFGTPAWSNDTALVIGG